MGAEDSGKLPWRFTSDELRWLQNYIWKLRQNWRLTPETIPFILSSFEMNRSLSFPRCVLIKFLDQRELEWILLRQTVQFKWLQRSNADFYLLTVDYNWQWQDKHFLCCCLAAGCDWCREAVNCNSKPLKLSLLSLLMTLRNYLRVGNRVGKRSFRRSVCNWRLQTETQKNGEYNTHEQRMQGLFQRRRGLTLNCTITRGCPTIRVVFLFSAKTTFSYSYSRQLYT